MLLKTWMWQGLLATLLLVPRVAPAELERQMRSTPSAFFLSRSENQNQVHYAVHVGEDCRPLGPAPVYAYWRMLEKGERETEPLLDIEVPIYGVADEQPVVAIEHGWRIRIQVKAHPDRPIELTVTREKGMCTARAWMTLEGSHAQLDQIFVRTRWPFQVDYVRLSGTAPDGHAVSELIHP